MNVPSVTLIGFLFISHGFCQTITPQLIGGRQTSISNYPYLAGIFTNSFFTCGGAIINFRSVLTVSENNNRR
jgi:secreted trypsin-like serine protease